MDNHSDNKQQFKLDILNLIAILCYLAIIIGSKMQFIPINESSWFQLGMGKYVGVAAIFAIFSLFMKNYFAAFFISIFAAFFSFHELIIFYDSFAIENGAELGSNGSFRLITDIFNDALRMKYGVFWTVYGSCISLVIVSLSWIRKVFKANRQIVINK